jgi:hypothetical protein
LLDEGREPLWLDTGDAGIAIHLLVERIDLRESEISGKRKMIAIREGQPTGSLPEAECMKYRVLVIQDYARVLNDPGQCVGCLCLGY